MPFQYTYNNTYIVIDTRYAKILLDKESVICRGMDDIELAKNLV